MVKRKKKYVPPKAIILGKVRRNMRYGQSVSFGLTDAEKRKITLKDLGKMKGFRRKK